MTAPANPWTPGPWIADDFCMHEDRSVRVGTYDGSAHYYHRTTTIAECCVKHPALGDEMDVGEPAIGIVTAEANARLIAAAPDLYDALSSLMEDKRFQVAVGGNPNVVNAMLDRARVALSKARGETP